MITIPDKQIANFITPGPATSTEAITLSMYGYTWTQTKTWEYMNKGKKKYTSRNKALKACKTAAKCSGITKTVS